MSAAVFSRRTWMVLVLGIALLTYQETDQILQVLYLQMPFSYPNKDDLVDVLGANKFKMPE